MRKIPVARHLFIGLPNMVNPFAERVIGRRLNINPPRILRTRPTRDMVEIY